MNVLLRAREVTQIEDYPDRVFMVPAIEGLPRAGEHDPATKQFIACTCAVADLLKDGQIRMRVAYRAKNLKT